MKSTQDTRSTAPTRRERLFAALAAIVLVIGLGFAWSLGGAVAALVDGHGFRPAYPRLHLSSLGASLKGEDKPLVTISGGGSTTPWLIAGIVLAVLWLLLVVVPLARRGRGDERRKALLSTKDAEDQLSLSAARKSGEYTRRDLASTRKAEGTDLGYYLGQLRDEKRDVWVDFEKRVRIIARPGWGKTSRLLVPIARGVPGAALIGSVKADLFEQTVAARESRGPVRVVDFSDPNGRIAEGFTEVTWDPIPGCEDLAVAERRARALVAGSEDGNREDQDDAFWRQSARQVIEAWFHAAALAGLDIGAVLRWQEDIHAPEPRDILRDHPRAEPRARMALTKHLDDRAERTTSSVERFIVLALGPFGSHNGRRFVGERTTSLDIRQSIADHETIYLLASEDTSGAAAPILTLFAEEWFYQARSLTAVTPGSRLTPPAVAIIDELRWLVPLPSLPAIAARDRAAGIGLVYAVQAMRQETELYGPSAESLEQAVQVTILGGYDKSAAQTITQQAGHASVTSVSVGGGFWTGPHFTDSEQYREAITAADQQQLRDGEAVLRVAGMPLTYIYTPSFRQNKRLRAQVAQEETEVQQRTAAARQLAAQDRARQLEVASREYRLRRSATEDEPRSSW